MCSVLKNPILTGSCVALSLRIVGESIWKILETHSNKTNSVLKVLKPDCTYQVKVQVQCLSRVYNTNDFITLRAPEGCKHSCCSPQGLPEWGCFGLRNKNIPAMNNKGLSMGLGVVLDWEKERAVHPFVLIFQGDDDFPPAL